ncbi:MAG TPA: NUDIX hydrolase [Firmicutes bacterium]|nr:NUDIX hydrolase [Bacillota bacterium]
MHYIEAINQFIPKTEQQKQTKKVILDYLETYGDQVLIRENEIAHLTSSGFVMNESLDKVLMIYHHLFNSFAWTGGHADGDCDLLEVAMKEACEETGIKQVKPLSHDIISLDILPVWGHFKKGNYVTAHLHLNTAYLLIASVDETLVVKEDENSAVEWISVTEIEKRCTEPELIPIYHYLIEQAKQINENRLA